MRTFDNIFNADQINELKRNIQRSAIKEVQEDLGRLNIQNVSVPLSVYQSLFPILKNISSSPLDSYGEALCVVYSNEYGHPNLPPHFDGDNTELIVNYQLDSNTDWQIGIDFETLKINNNSAIIFNPNDHIHWRPHKTFLDNEYVTMVFFRFYNPYKKNDLLHKSLKQDDPVFKDILNYRNSLS